MLVKTCFKNFFNDKAQTHNYTAQSLKHYQVQATVTTPTGMPAALSAWNQHVVLTNSRSNKPQLLHHLQHIPRDTPNNMTDVDATWALSGHHGA